MKDRIVAVIAMLLIVCPAESWAQAPFDLAKVENFPGNVYRAERLFVIAQKDKSRPSNGAISFGVRRSDTRALQALETGFQARIFSLPEGADRPRSFPSEEECLIYLSLLLNIPKQPAAVSIEVAGLDIRWTHAQVGKALQPSRYLVVFEDRFASSTLLRLQTVDRDKYFGSGVVVEVHPAPLIAPISQDEINKLAESQRQRSLDSAKLLEIERLKLNCFSLPDSKIVVDESMIVSAIESCTDTASVN